MENNYQNLKNLTSFINAFIKQKNYNNYLELGTMNGNTFLGVACKNKISVDDMSCGGSFVPNFVTSTDIFFRDVAPKLDMKFDIIFIDALHESEQTHKDIINSLNYLEEAGLIITHDTLPHTKHETKLSGQGTAFESFIKLRCENSELKMCSLDFFNEASVSEEGIGIGLIRKGSQETYNIEPADVGLDMWSLYEKNKKQLMNVISLSQLGGWLSES